MENLLTLDRNHESPCLYDEHSSTKRRKLDYDPFVHPNNSNNVCQHPEIVFKLCTHCGMDIDDQATLNRAVFGHLLQQKKLSLVLDLDHTLLHSVPFENLPIEEQELVANYGTDLMITRPKITSKGGLFRTVINGVGFVTKLRPGLGYFLAEASKLFSLHVFTMGSLDYAVEMFNLIDPGQVYFESMSRVFTRESINRPRGQKTLDLVAGEPRGTLIVDDQERVWKEKDRENLLLIPGYYFFSNSRPATGEVGKYSGLIMGTDESETDGYLNLVLEVLKQIHQMFFNHTDSEGIRLNPADRDVRELKYDLYEENVKKFWEIEEQLLKPNGAT